MFICREASAAYPAFTTAAYGAATSAVSGVYDTVLNGVTLRTAHPNGYRSSADLPQQLARKLRRAAVRVPENR